MDQPLYPEWLTKVLFLDLETVSTTETYQELPERLKSHWDKKAAFFSSTEEKEVSDWYEDRGAIFAEFGKIIVISMGYLTPEAPGELQLRIKSLYGHEERKVLEEFSTLLEQKFNQDELILCAHNGKEFDFPYLCRRLLVNGLPLPAVLRLSGKKPWEIPHMDTMELWKFGDWKHFTSLDLLASIFDIPSSKSELDGSQVGDAYYKEGRLNDIRDYCNRDVYVTVQVFLRLNSLPVLKQDQVIFLDQPEEKRKK